MANECVADDCIVLESHGPMGAICRDCIFARGINYKGKNIYVCDRLDALDISPEYRACYKFEGKEEYYWKKNMTLEK